MATGSTTSSTSDVRTTVPHPRAGESAPEPERPTRSRWRPRWPRYTWSGTVGALLFGCSSLTPSLLPRGWMVQGIVCGITAALGYGAGVTVAWFVGQLSDRRPQAPLRRRAWQVLAVAGPVVTLVMLWLGSRWQRDVHLLMGMQPPPLYAGAGSLAVAVVLFVVLIGLARLVRKLTRALTKLVTRVLPRRVARPLAVVAVGTLLVVLLNGVLFRGLVEAANSSFSLRDGRTEAGAVRPEAPERSGSPDSLVSWESLGLQGRNFVGTGPTVEELAAFSGGPALEPVRVYAGLQSAAEIEDRADLVVRELQRAGGFDRRALVVVTTTGTGWVDPAASAALEYELAGDTAMVAMQYSYLPSWISYLVDQAKARDAGRALFDAVYGVYAQLPLDDRPELYVLGESLGTYGGEAAFSGLGDISNRTDGVLWAGPPNFNALWRGIVSDREDRTPEWRPVYEDGRTVRFADEASDLTGPSGTWEEPRLVYLQNASDPIVWWSPRLSFWRPDWLQGERAPDVSGSMVWLPLVTFWQVTADLAFAVDVPDGHGHRYEADYVDGWAGVARPPGWTDADTERLRDLLSGS